jgi:hypothetical protein
VLTQRWLDVVARQDLVLEAHRERRGLVERVQPLDLHLDLLLIHHLQLLCPQRQVHLQDRDQSPSVQTTCALEPAPFPFYERTRARFDRKNDGGEVSLV